MNISIEEVEYCKINIKYEASLEAIQNKKQEIVNKFKEQKVPGYRPGHATNDAVKQHYRKEINDYLKKELAEEAVHNVIVEKNIKPFGRPIFSSMNLDNGNLLSFNGEPASPQFRCEFSLMVQPEFNLGSYKDFELPKPQSDSSEVFSQKMLQELRVRHGQTIQYNPDDFVQMGDNVILDLKTFSNDQLINDMSGDGEILNVGRINIPGFSESILGMKPEETREFVLNMPDSYKEEFAGKPLRFEVKIIMGSKIEPAALDDDLAKKIGIETFDKLMDNITATATTRIKELNSSHNMDQISRRLIDNHDFKIPIWIATAEAQINARNAGKVWESVSYKEKTEYLSDKEKEEYIDLAGKSIKLSLILQKIRENEPDAQLTDEEVFESAKQNIAKHSKEPEKVMTEIFKNGHLPLLFNRIRDEYALSFIEKTCKFVE